MKHSITLLGRVPSKKNSKRRIQRGRNIFMVPSEAHEVWHKEQMMWVRLGWPRMLVLSSVRKVQITFFAGDKRAGDLSNKAESIMDLLVDAQILKDDNWFVVPELLLKMGGVDKEKPRAEIIIYS